MGGFANKCWRIVVRVLGVLCVLGGAGSCIHRSWYEDPGQSQPVYGPMHVQLPVGDVGYQPPSPVHAGTMLTFTAQLPQGNISQAVIDAGTAGSSWQHVELFDNGVMPDQAAGDRIFTGQLVWQAEYGRGEIYVRMLAIGQLDGDDAQGGRILPTLTVLP